LPYQLTICVPVEATSDTLACDCYVHQYGAIAAGRRAPHYPSDMTDAEWAQVRASMPVPAEPPPEWWTPSTRPREGSVKRSHLW
jgi:hypothetical protein